MTYRDLQAIWLNHFTFCEEISLLVTCPRIVVVHYLVHQQWWSLSQLLQGASLSVHRKMGGHLIAQVTHKLKSCHLLRAGAWVGVGGWWGMAYFGRCTARTVLFTLATNIPVE